MLDRDGGPFYPAVRSTTNPIAVGFIPAAQIAELLGHRSRRRQA